MIRPLIFSLFGLFLVACDAQSPTLTNIPLPTETPVPAKTAIFTPSPLPPTRTLQPTTPPPTSTPEAVVCSPLDEIVIAELPDLIYNPFAPPRLGSDDPHQGVDFANIDPIYALALEGRPVQAVLSGQVTTIINDRFPYGYAILVETPLEQIPSGLLEFIQIPTPAPTQKSHSSLTCPPIENPPTLDFSQRSLYLMYAHLNDPFTFHKGDRVNCGQILNVIGNSGNSLNPHLHLEVRVGPAGANFESIAHYTGSASPEEMQNYCIWRVSETFQLIDPMELFSQVP